MIFLIKIGQTEKTQIIITKKILFGFNSLSLVIFFIEIYYIYMNNDSCVNCN